MSDRVPRHLGKYEVLEPLGSGGMAEVWKAFDTQLRRQVAIKVIHPNIANDPVFIQRFTREAQTIAMLRHPNIMRIHDLHVNARREDGSDDTITYMVMEYIQGQTLAQYLRGDARARDLADPAAIIHLFAPICRALDYAHQQLVIHRDIKPANILLDQTNTTRNPMGEPMLSDFGLAKALTGGAATVTGTVIGTPLYMSPEQIQDKPLTKEADLYSLAAVLYEVCAGAPPFDGESVPGILMRHLTEEPTPPDQLNPHLPTAVSSVLARGLAKEPRDRYHSAVALLVALAEAFGVAIPNDVAERGGLREGATPASADATILPMAATSASATILPGAAASATASAVSLPSGGTTLARFSARLPTPIVKAGQTALARLPTPQAVRRLSGPQRALAIALVVVLLASGLGGYILLTHRALATSGAASTMVGQALFVSSGQVNSAVTTGINDEVQINLQGIPAPQAGKAYYAWLLPDTSQSEAPDVLLGRLIVKQGAIHFLYRGDSQHTDLLAITSRFLITEESASVTLEVPSPDLSAWRYYAALPQKPAPGQKYSLLDHLRHLLASDPNLEAAGLHGGLDIWAFRDTQQVFQWALGARNEWNAQRYDSVRYKAIAMLDLLDGSANVGRDAPAGSPIAANATIAQVGLLEFSPTTQNPPGYLYHIALHVNGVLQSPGSTQYQRTEATQITTALDAIKLALGQARHDATQLANMSDNQLAQPATLSLLNDLVTAMTTAYQGKVNPTTNQAQNGMSQLYPDVQKLATLRVASYGK